MSLPRATQRIASYLQANKTWLILGAILAVHSAVNIVWIEQDLTLRGYDAGPHVEAVARSYAVISREGLGGVVDIARGERAGIWPSASYLPWVLLSKVFGLSYPTLRMLNIIFSAVLLLSVFLIGRRVASERVGLWAALLVILYPGIYGESRQFGVDFPSAALTAMCMALLLSTEKLARFRQCLLFGVGLGLGILIRPQILFFIFVPAAILLGLALVRPEPVSRKHVLINAATCVIVAAVISSVWWAGRLGEIGWILRSHQEGDQFPLAAITRFYVQSLPWLFSPFLLVIGTVAVLALAVRSRLNEPNGPRRIIGCKKWFADPTFLLLWASIISGFVFHCFFRVQCLRYMLPLSPAAAVITAAGLQAITQRSLRRIILIVTVGVSGLTGVMDSFMLDLPHNYGFARSPAELGALRVTSGPPRIDPRVHAAVEIGDYLRARHGTGRGLLVRVINRLNEHDRRYKFAWNTTPILRSKLPELQPTGETHFVRPPGRSHYDIGGAAIQNPRDRVTACYLLKLDPRGHPTRPDTYEHPATRRYHKLVMLNEGREAQITLWQLSRCTKDLDSIQTLQLWYPPNKR